MAENPNVITTEVEASEETVKTVRADMPVGQGGTPIDRIPLNPMLVSLEASGVFTKRIASTDRCIRLVDVPVKGGGSVKCHCSRACVGVGDMKICPEHDKGAFAPNQTPVPKGRTINSASVPLTKAEMEVRNEKNEVVGHLKDSVAPSAAPALSPAQQHLRAVAEALDKTSAEPHHDLKVFFTLDELAGRDVLAVITARIAEALDGLPCHNVREMKQIVALQEKIEKLSKGGKRAKSKPTAETL